MQFHEGPNGTVAILGQGPMIDTESVLHMSNSRSNTGSGGYAKSQVRFSNGTTGFLPDSISATGSTVGLPDNSSKDFLIANRSDNAKVELTAAGGTSTIEAKVGANQRIEVDSASTFFLESLTVVDGTDKAAGDKYEIGVDADGDLVVSGTGATLGGLASAPDNTKKFAYEPLSPTPASKFVLYDVNPTSSINDAKSKVMVTWNWRSIEGTHSGSADGKLVYSAGFDHAQEISDGFLSWTDATNNTLVDQKKKFFFSNTSNTYTITAWDKPNNTFTLTDDDGNVWDPTASGEGQNGGTISIATTADPARIIDRADGYTLTVKEDGQPGVVEIAHLELDQVQEPFHYFNLDIGKTYTMTLVSKNGNLRSAPVSLSAHTFDPSATDNNQANVSYSVPWVNTLPALDDTNANSTNITAESTAFGFNINIGADVWAVTGKPDQTAHEFEIGWTTQASFAWDAASTQKIITQDRFKTVTMNAPANVKIGVRPLQNRNIVSGLNAGSGYIFNVTSGGGGIPPGDQQILSTMFDVLVISGQIDTQSGDTLTLDNAQTEQGGVNITINNDGMNGQMIIIDNPGLSDELPVENTNTLIN